MRTIILLALALVLLAGCASLKETIQGISANPTDYILEATESADNVQETVPELPYAICMGIGYAAAFLRGWYKKHKIQQAKDSGRVAT